MPTVFILRYRRKITSKEILTGRFFHEILSKPRKFKYGKKITQNSARSSGK